MDQYQIDFSLQAQEHLDDICSFVKNELNAPFAARRIVTQIKEEIASFKAMQQRIQLVSDEPWFSLGVRRDRGKNYYI